MESMMAKNEERVMQFVEAELERNPEVATSDLFEKAKKVDTGLSKLSLRQFNARFPLQVKRRKSLATPGKAPRKGRARAGGTTRGGGRRASQNRRDAMREVFLRFASDLAGAEERKDVVRVLAGVEAYVDEGLKAAGR
jgi:hypothetical protein